MKLKNARKFRTAARRGFTMVELALAMAFIAVLMITIAYLTINISSIYQKGLSMRAVTSTGRQLVEDFKSSIAASIAPSVKCDQPSGSAAGARCETDGGRKAIYIQHSGKVKINNEEKTVPMSGIFCTDRYVYVWNTGYALNRGKYPREKGGGTAAVDPMDGSQGLTAGDFGDGNLTLIDTSSKQGLAYRLAKISNPSKDFCAAAYNKDRYENEPLSDGDHGAYHISVSNADDVEEMLRDSEDSLALYDLNIYPPATHALTAQAFYSGTFILGTLGGGTGDDGDPYGGVDITAQGDYCTAAPDGLTTDFDYCSINKFNFAVRATGKSNKV